ncbi:hypothetical protein EDB89DRAFT_1179181 [Lactarius sanguifluus]|nr:hypothetical protein EDB89DRAFT_1179181 [Lactarius sanguifluus]
MKPCAQTLREVPGSLCRATPARLLHTLFVFGATSLMLALVIYTFLLLLILRSVSPERASRRERHVTFQVESETSESSRTPARRAPPPPPPPRLAEQSKPTPPPVPTRATVPSLSLTVTPRELEPPTPDVAEDPLRALTRICAFLVSNTARATQRDELGATPPLAGLEPYLDAVNVDLAYIDEVVVGKRAEAEEGERSADDGPAATEVEITESSKGAGDAGAIASTDSGLDAGAGVNAGAHAHDEPDLVQPQQAVSVPAASSSLPIPIPNSTYASTSAPAYHHQQSLSPTRQAQAQIQTQRRLWHHHDSPHLHSSSLHHGSPLHLRQYDSGQPPTAQRRRSARDAHERRP